MHWAEAMLQVSIRACMAWHLGCADSVCVFARNCECSSPGHMLNVLLVFCISTSPSNMQQHNAAKFACTLQLGQMSVQDDLIFFGPSNQVVLTMQLY